MSENKPAATLLITTRNRREELGAALNSALQQSVPLEILVIDDGSSDGTAAMVREKYPQVRLESSETSLGYIAQRNRGAQLASCDFIISMDDDAVFSTPEVIEQTLTEFSDARIGAVAIPFVNAGSEVVNQRAPDKEHVWIADRYVGTAHALRRDVFLRIGGYREFFVHQGEEGDFCLRMLDAGYVVRVGSADVIHHLESPRRDLGRMDYYGRRNDILFAALNVPFPQVGAHLVATTLNGLRTARQHGRYRRMFRGIFDGYVDAMGMLRARKPVSPNIYRLSRRIRKAGAVRLEEIEHALPPTPIP